MMSAIRVFVGSAPSHRLMVDVLRWSIERRASMPVEVVAMSECFPNGLPMPAKPENRPGTPFSFQRFAVPELAGYRGRAIYLDSDQLVLRDIAELYARPMWGMRLQCRPKGGPDGKRGRHRSSVMLLDCGRLDWSVRSLVEALDAGRYDYRTLMSLNWVRGKGRFPRHWNALDHFEPATGLLHYTDRSRQPWVGRDHPHAALWFEALFDGLERGAITQQAVDFSVENGYVRRSLAWQCRQRVADPAAVPAALKAADAPFYERCRAQQFNNLDGDYRQRG